MVSERHRPYLLALAAALLGAYIMAATFLHTPPGLKGADVDQFWYGARAILHGQDMYALDQVERLFPTRIYYPLTVAVVALPLGLLPLEWARLLFVTLSAGVFGYAIGKHRPHLWPALLGMPFIVSMRSAQWAPLLTAAMLLPSLGWLAAVKPNLGIVMLAAVRTRRAALILIGGGFLVVALSLAISPRWPLEWRDALRVSTHFRPLLVRPAGFVMLLALLRWRDPDARLLLALALVPISGLFYDLLPACLVCQNRKQAALLAVASHLTWMGSWGIPRVAPDLAQQMWLNGTLMLWFGLLPALAIVLARSFPVSRLTFRKARAV